MVGQIQKRQDQKQYLQAIPTRATRGIYKRNSLRYKIADKKKGGVTEAAALLLGGFFFSGATFEPATQPRKFLLPLPHGVRAFKKHPSPPFSSVFESRVSGICPNAFLHVFCTCT